MFDKIRKEITNFCKAKRFVFWCVQYPSGLLWTPRTNKTITLTLHTLVKFTATPAGALYPG